MLRFKTHSWHIEVIREAKVAYVGDWKVGKGIAKTAYIHRGVRQTVFTRLPRVNVEGRKEASILDAIGSKVWRRFRVDYQDERKEAQASGRENFHVVAIDSDEGQHVQQGDQRQEEENIRHIRFREEREGIKEIEL